MIIIITSQGNLLTSKPNPHFGRTPSFIKYNIDDDAWEYLQNAAAEEPGGAGVAAAQFVIDHGALAVVSGSFGPNAFRSLKAARIQMFTFDSHTETIEEVVQAFKNNTLNKIDQPEIRK